MDCVPGTHVPFSPVVSGVLPSIMFSNEPEVSSRRRTFGKGTLAAPIWAFASFDRNKVTASAYAPSGAQCRAGKLHTDRRIAILLIQLHPMGPATIRPRDVSSPSDVYELVVSCESPTEDTVYSMKQSF